MIYVAFTNDNDFESATATEVHVNLDKDLVLELIKALDLPSDAGDATVAFIKACPLVARVIGTPNFFEGHEDEAEACILWNSARRYVLSPD